MAHPDLQPFLRRLATAAGIASIPLLGALAEEVTQKTVCAPLDDTGGACPSPVDALMAFQDPDGWGSSAPDCAVTAVLADAARVGADCCYTVQVECPTVDPEYPYETLGVTGCMGRPFLAEGEAVVATLLSRPLRPGGVGPDLSGLDLDDRHRLAQFWIGVALAEHASVAEFHRVCLELLRHGAPTALLARAHAAIVDETRHARRCFALASAFAARTLEPGPVPLPSRVALADDLAGLAHVTARDGCVAETCSAWLYGRLLVRATDPAVRQVIAGVVRDETRHAELAWATLRWALATGGPAAREAAQAALAHPPPTAPDRGEADVARLAAFGWAPASRQNAATEEAWRRVVLPMGTAVLCALGST